MAVWPEELRLADAAPRGGLTQAWGATLTGGRFTPARRDAGMRIIPKTAPAGGAPPPGRGLDAYRAAPIGMGWRRVGG